MPVELGAVAPWAYGFALLVFVAFSAYLGLGWKGGGLGARVLAAVVLSALWAALELLSIAYWPQLRITNVPAFADFARLAAWSFFFSGLLRQASPDLAGSRRLNVLLPAGWTLMGAGVVGLAVSASTGGASADTIHWLPMLHLLLSIWFLVLIEQVYRNFPEGPMQEVQQLLESIVQEAAGL